MNERGSYRAVFESIADDPDFQNLSPLAQAIFWTLKLKLGQYGIAVFYVSTLPDLHRRAKPAAITKALTELEEPKRAGRRGWIVREGNVVWIINGLRFEPSITVDNKNHRTGALKYVRTLPQCPVVSLFIAYYDLEDGPRNGAGSPLPPHTLSHPDGMPNGGHMGGGITDTDTDTEQETETEIPLPEPRIRFCAAANKGLEQHQTRPQLEPRVLPNSGKAYEATEEILAAGVPVEFAESAIYNIATSHDADGQITSLKYFTGGVLRLWRKNGATNDAKRSNPAALPANGNGKSRPSTPGERGYQSATDAFDAFNAGRNGGA